MKLPIMYRIDGTRNPAGTRARALTRKGWKEIAKDGYPPEHRTVVLAREGDLYPVIGEYFGVEHGDHLFMLEEGGAEDDARRSYPFLFWTPTHWRDIPLDWQILD